MGRSFDELIAKNFGDAFQTRFSEKGIVRDVQDFRFTGGDPYIQNVGFFSTNSGWLTTNQVMQLPDYKKALKEGARMGPIYARQNGLLDEDGNRVDRQANPAFHSFNFPHSLPVDGGGQIWFDLLSGWEEWP